MLQPRPGRWLMFLDHRTPDIAQSGIPFSINLDGFSGLLLPDDIADIALSTTHPLVRLKSRKVAIAHRTSPRDTAIPGARWQKNAASHQISGFTFTPEPPSFSASWA